LNDDSGDVKVLSLNILKEIFHFIDVPLKEIFIPLLFAKIYDSCINKRSAIRLAALDCLDEYLFNGIKKSIKFDEVVQFLEEDKKNKDSSIIDFVIGRKSSR
jgi:hypothetical protein